MMKKIAFLVACLLVASCAELMWLVKVKTRTREPAAFLFFEDFKVAGGLHGLYLANLPPTIPRPQADSSLDSYFFFDDFCVFASAIGNQKNRIS